MKKIILAVIILALAGVIGWQVHVKSQPVEALHVWRYLIDFAGVLALLVLAEPK